MVETIRGIGCQFIRGVKMPAALWPRASLLRRSLFWKILLAFWLTLLLAGVGAGLVVWWHIPKHEHQPLSGGLRTALLLHMAESVLVHGDETTLRRILIDWSGREAPILPWTNKTASCWAASRA